MLSLKDVVEQYKQNTAMNRPTLRDAVENYKTSEVANNDEGLIDFVGRNLKIGGASAVDTFSKVVENATRPENMTPTEWHNTYRGKTLQDWADEVIKSNVKEYNRDTDPIKYYSSMMLQSLPESAVDMGAGIAAGAVLGGPLGAGAALVKNLLTAGKWGKKIYDAYNGASTAAKFVRRITPNSNTIAATGVGSHLEALGEGQRAKDEYIEDAKRNGTYIQDKTELEAEEIGNKVYRDNMAIIGGANAAEYNLMFGKHGGGLKNRVGRLTAAMAMEGGEEAAQEYATLSELGKPIDNQRLEDAAITGAAMGGIFNVAGQAAHYPAERRLKKQSTELREWTNKITDGQMSDEVHNLIVNAADKYGVDRKLALALATAESNGNQNDISGVGAIGVMQLMPETARELGVDPHDVKQNIDGGVRYLKQQLDAVGGDWQKAAAAYNAGLGNVQKYGGIPPFSETQAYVKRIGDFLNKDVDFSGNNNQQNNDTSIFGVENYNMPTQSERINDQVNSLKAGWNDILPQIGGVLKDKFNLPTTISSAARTAEHNANVGGVPNSYHIIRENGGDAVDMVFDRDTTAEERQQIIDYFKSTGLFKEVLYHNVNSGYHLHLGGLQTDKLNNFSNADTQTQSDQNQIAHQDETPSKPLFDINDDDNSLTQQMFLNFMNRWRNTANGEDLNKNVDLYNNVFDDKDQFINTKENRDLVRERFADELTDYANSNLNEDQSQEENLQTSTKPEYVSRNDAIRGAYKALIENDVQNKNLKGLIHKSEAVTPAQMEQVLRENNISIPPYKQQTQQSSQTENGAAIQKATEIASQPISNKVSERIKQGKALSFVATERNVELPYGVTPSLNEGSIKAIETAQKVLQENGILDLKPSRNINGVNGKSATVSTDNNKKYDVNYKVVEINDLVTSDNETYPQELQPRDRTNRKSLLAQVAQMSQNLMPEKLMSSDNLNQGAPIIREDGVILNGNGRTQAIRQAYSDNSADNYRQALMDNADQFGLDRNQIAKMKQPVLVRQINGDVANSDLADITQSTTGGSRMSATEQSKIDADKLTGSLLSKYVENDTGDFTTSANDDFVGSVLGRILNKNEWNAYTDGNGNASADGISRVKRAVFAKAYGDEGLISKMAESTDDNAKNVSSALMNVAPKMAAVQIQMDEGSLHKYDVAKPLSEAVQKLNSLREQNIPVNSYLNQQSMFDEYKDSDEMREILSFMDANKRSGRKISAFLNQIVDTIRAQGDPRQVQLISGSKPLKLLDIIKAARDKVENGGQQDLFADTEDLQKRNAEAVKVLEIAENEEKQAADDISLPNGYRTESDRPLNESDSREFIVDENGNKNFGVIDKKTANAANIKLKNSDPRVEMKAAPIRLQVGNENFGYIHLTKKHLSQIKSKGFNNAIDYIDHVLNNFNQIYNQSFIHKKSGKLIKRFVLYCKGDESKGFIPIDLELENDGNDFYTIVSAMPHNEKIKGELVFDGSSQPSTVAADRSLIEDSNNKSGVVSSRANAKTNSPVENISQNEEKINNEDVETAFEADENYEQPEEVTNQTLFKVGNTAKGYPTATINTDLQQRIVDKINNLAESYDGTHQQDGSYKFKFPEDRDGFVLDTLDLIEQDRLEQLEAEKTAKLERMKAGRAKAKANAAKWTDEKLDQVVADNPDLKAVVKQLGGTTLDGHVHFKKNKNRNQFIKHLENLENSDFKLSIAYNGSPADFNEFSLDYIGTGEGAQLHGWGLYFAADKNVSEGYRNKLDHSGYRISSSKYGTLIISKNDWSIFSENKFLYFLKNDRGTSTDIALKTFGHNKGDKAKAISQLEKMILQNDTKISEKRKKQIIRAVKILQNNDFKIEIANPARLYKVQIPDADVMIDKHKSFIEQPQKVKVALQKLFSEKNIDKKYLINNDGGGIYSVLSASLGNDKAASLALNEASIKGLSYNSRLDGRCYVVFDDKAIKILEKWSKQGINNPTIENFVDPKDLSDLQSGIAYIGDKLGVPVIFFKGDKNLNGAHANGITYINVNSPVNLRWIFWHESGHWLKSQHPEFIDKIINKLEISEEQCEDFRERTSRYDLTDNEVREEIFADNMFDADKRLDILQTLNKKDASLLDKFVSWLKTVMDTFTSFFNTPKYGLTNRQKNLMFDELGKALRQIRDTDEKTPRYRYGNTSHVMQYADGRDLPKMDIQRFAEDIDKKVDMDDNISNKVFEKYLNDGIMNMVKETVTNEINKYVDISKMSDPVARDYARDKLPYIRRLLTQYNSKTIQRNENYKNHYATKIEYARRCFDDDERIRNEAFRQVVGDKGQSGVRGNRNEIRPNSDTHGNGRIVRQGNVGVSRNVSGEKDGAYKQFLHLYDEIANDEKHSEQGAFSNAKYSMGNDDSKIKKAFRSPLETLAKALHLKGDKIITDEMRKKELQQKQNEAIDKYLKNPKDAKIIKTLHELKVTKGMIQARQQGIEYEDDISLRQEKLSSPSRLAEHVALFRAYFNMGERSMKKLVALRDEFARHYEKTMSGITSKDERNTLFKLLLTGDAEGKEYGVLTDDEKAAINSSEKNAFRNARVKKICNEADVSKNVAEAYLGIRAMLNHAYNLIDETRRKQKTESKRLTDDQLKARQDNKFIRIDKINPKDKDGKQLVTWTDLGHHEHTYTNITQDMVDKLKQDDDIQVVSVLFNKNQNDIKLYNVKVREGIPKLNKLTGYIPHFFHEYMIRIRDTNGKLVATLGSGRTQREAIKLAEKWKQDNKLDDGAQIHIEGKAFDFGDLGMNEKDYAPIMGDKDFFKMSNKIAENNSLTLDEAKQLLNGSVRLKSRHRFLGNTMNRKGVKGYSEDLNWVLRHYFNMASRYVALETEFKPKAISLFERMFGDFSKDYTKNKNSVAQYVKTYIENVNGNPTHEEILINKIVGNNSIYKNFIAPTFGDRAALTAVNWLTGKTALAKLGIWNISSAFLNYSQLINASGYLGGAGRILKHAASVTVRRGNLTQKELRILNETGVLQDIGMDTSTSYDKNRDTGSMNKIANMISYLIGNKSMQLFQTADVHCRIATTFAAYEKAIIDGKSRQEAIKYARDINRKSNFSYGVEDAPQLFRNTIFLGKIMGQFQKYPVKMIEVMSDFAPWSNRTNLKQKISFWVPYFLMTGLMGIPALNWLDDLFKKFGFNIKDNAQKWIMENFNDTETQKYFGKFLMYGGGALANVDISTRAGLGDLRIPDVGGPLWNTFTGASKNAFNGEYLNAIRSVSPGVYNIAAAIIGETEGSRGRTNRVYDDVGRLRRLAGFKSVDESLDVDINRIVNNEKSKRSKERQEVIDALVDNPFDQDMRKRARELRITGEMVRKERRLKKLDKLSRIERNIPKRERKDYQYLFDFAK